MEVIVSVTHQGIFRTELSIPRPVRRLPDGCAGVVYQNRVYPLYEGNEIDLADLGFDKSEVSPPHASGDVPRFAKRTSALVPIVDRWSVETTSLGSYLIFDGAESQASVVIDLLSDIGLPWTRWDRSVRKARDGHQYDWWIRFDREITEDVLKRIFEDVNRQARKKDSDTGAISSPSNDTLEIVGDRASEIEKEIAVLRSLNRKLEEERDQALARARDLDDLLDLEQRNAERERNEAQLTQARLSESLRDRDSQLARASGWISREGESQNSEVARLRAQVVALEYEKSQVDVRRNEAERKCDRLSAEIDRLQRDCADLNDRRIAAEDRADQYREERAASRNVGVVVGILDAAFPRLHFDKASIADLLQFRDFRPIMKLINSLNANDGQVRIGSVSGYKGVKEVDAHIKTGISGRRADMGRIYLKELSEEPDMSDDVPKKYSVFVSIKDDKAQQDRVLRSVQLR